MKIRDLEKLPEMQTVHKQYYLVYCRKSSESEDRQMASLEDQKKALLQLARQKNLLVLQVFEESKSAKEPGRPIFNEVIQLVHKRDDIKGILVWSLSRASRNPVDTATIQWLLQKGVVEEIVTPTRTYTEFDSDFVMAIEGAQANRFIRDLKKDTARGVNSKIEKGMAPILARPGYKNNTEKRQGERDISPHPTHFQLMRKIFELAMTGQFSTLELMGKAQELGIKNSRGKSISRTQMYKCLRDPFYCGKFMYAKRLHQGSHVPMLSIPEFDALQEILDGRSKPRKQTHEFTLSGFVKCGFCDYMFVGERHIKKSGLIFEYYTCTQHKKGKCDQGFFSAKDLEGQVYEFLGKLKLSERFVEWATKWLKAAENQDRSVRDAKYTVLRNEHEELERKLNNLMDKWLEGTNLFTESEYSQHRQRYIQRMFAINQELQTRDEDLDVWTNLTIATFNFARTAQDRWEYGTLEDKKTILNVIGSNLTLKDKKLDISPRTPFLLIKDALESENKNLKGSNPQNEAIFREEFVFQSRWGG